MSDEKLPGPAQQPPPAPKTPPQEAEPDFFTDGEHDGWSPIVKRRPRPEPAPNE